MSASPRRFLLSVFHDASGASRRRLVLLFGLFAASTLLFFVYASRQMSVLQAQLPGGKVPLQLFLDTGLLQAGSHTFEMRVRTSGGVVTSASIPFSVSAPVGSGSGGGGGGSGGGGEGLGGGGGSGDTDGGSAASGGSSGSRRLAFIIPRDRRRSDLVTATEVAPLRSFRAHESQLSGSGPARKHSSDRFPDSSLKRPVVFLAGPGVRMTKTYPLARGEHILRVAAKRSFKPVQLRITVNGAPKIITWEAGSGYVTKAAGVLRNASRAAVSIEFLNDAFTCTTAQVQARATEKCDLNALISDVLFHRVRDLQVKPLKSL